MFLNINGLNQKTAVQSKTLNFNLSAAFLHQNAVHQHHLDNVIENDEF